MADKIEPALSAEEWAKLEADYREDLAAPREPYAKVHAWSIAVANRRLPDSDPRKITRDRLEEIRYYLPDDGSRALIDALPLFAALGRAAADARRLRHSGPSRFAALIVARIRRR